MFDDREIGSITADDVPTFLSKNTEGQKTATKRFKYTTLKTFFNSIKNTDPAGQALINPCDAPLLRKTFKVTKGRHWNILDKDVVDEIIFKTDNPRNRLLLELMARGGLRVGEVLKLEARDVEERKLYISNPKSGRQSEVVFIPQKVADRLKDYIRRLDLKPDQRIFPIGYTGANLVSTQLYLGKVSDTEAIRWIENIHG